MSNTYTRSQAVVVTSVAAVTTLLVGIAVGSGSMAGITDWLPALGAFATLAAVIVAFSNMRRQVRMALITREEALMEERHPGLQQAFNFVVFLNLKLIDGAYEKLPTLLQEYDARGKREVVTEGLEKRLPLTDAATKFLILGVFNHLNFAADLLEEGLELRHRYQIDPSRYELDETDLQNAAGMRDQGRSYYDAERIHLSQIELMLGNRLKNWNERLPRFRAEIEAYFKQ